MCYSSLVLLQNGGSCKACTLKQCIISRGVLLNRACSLTSTSKLNNVFLNDFVLIKYLFKMENYLKVPKREIFDRSDFPDFYTIKSLREGDFGVKI
jgi:hypothetical protein